MTERIPFFYQDLGRASFYSIAAECPNFSNFVVSASDLQSSGAGFESRSGQLLDLFSVVQF